jgi:hypothetical protein
MLFFLFISPLKAIAVFFLTWTDASDWGLGLHGQKHHLTASRLCSTVMQYYFKPKMESIIDKDSKISHENFAS